MKKLNTLVFSIVFMLVLNCRILGICESGFQPIPLEAEKAPYAPHEDCFLENETGYHDASLDIRIETMRQHDTNIVIAYVKMVDGSQLRTGLAAKYPSQKVASVQQMSKRYDAVLAINGDYFNYHNDGIIIRNGERLRNKDASLRDTLIIDTAGKFTIIEAATEETLASFDKEIAQTLFFGPGLIIDGKVITDEKIDSIKVKVGKDKRTQRMVLCQMEDLSYMIVACEGPENKDSQGLLLREIADICAELGAKNAYNLDGGSSTTLTLNHKKINGGELKKRRDVGDCVYFCTLVPDDNKAE